MPVASGSAQTRFSIAGQMTRRAGSFAGKASTTLVETGTAYISRILDVNAGDKLRLRVIRSDGSDTIYLAANGCAFTIEEL